MRTRRLLEAEEKAVSLRTTLLYFLVLALPSLFLFALISYGVSRFLENRRSSGEEVNREIWRHRQGPLAQEKLLLRLERAFYRLVIVPIIAFLPAPLAYGIACLHGDLRHRLETFRREQTMLCLEKVLGNQLSPIERVRITRDFFRLRSCQPIDITRLAGKGKALARLVEIRGIEHIQAALAAGKGAILCSAHFGNYNCALSLLGSLGFPITVIGRWTSNVDPGRSSMERFFYQLTDRKLLEHHRRRPNIEPLGQIEIAVQAAAILRQNELISIGLDAPLLLPTDRARGVSMNFLNGQALLLPGATTIAKLMGVPMLLTFMHRSADMRHQILEILPPISLEGDSVVAYKRYLAVVEDAIRREPAHWTFWDFFSLVKLGLLPAATMNALT